MKGSAVRAAAAAVLILSAVMTVSAEDVFRFGVCSLSPEGSGTGTFAAGISGIIFDSLYAVKDRRLDSDEIKALLQKRKQKELNNLLDKKEDLLVARDERLFSGEDPETLKKNISSDEESIETVDEEIDAVRLELSDIGNIDRQAKTMLPVEIKEPEDGRLFEKLPGRIDYTADQYGLDMVCFGEIDRIDNYIYVQIKIWNSITEELELEWKTAAEPEQIYSMLEPGLDEIKTVLLGREWAMLSVESVSNSMIYINGEFRGIEKIEGIILEPGSYRVKSRLPGYREEIRDINLEKFTRADLYLENEKITEKSIILQTFPAEADVYLDSEWKGRTPLKLSIGSLPAAVRIEKDGWEKREFFINSFSENLINIDLKPALADRDQMIEDSRNRFYGSLGGFILSIPVTAISFGLAEQSAGAYEREYAANGTVNLDELLRLEDIHLIEYSIYAGSLGLNIILFFDTILKAVEYISIVDYSSN